ncbi:hypothetical protein [Flammeovirga aprica]|uniref:Uncharacterized protein n=1 Tax=Flammeovirga aprica JL-4 TaxID=694437 RepID=A0A7X9RZE3_9BACT|nr:hypothetical protein [Flammeovirga aprica]NME71568.1 hypothetical protein [Flammeovirga aprica JL-4]
MKFIITRKPEPKHKCVWRRNGYKYIGEFKNKLDATQAFPNAHVEILSEKK